MKLSKNISVEVKRVIWLTNPRLDYTLILSIVDPPILSDLNRFANA